MQFNQSTPFSQRRRSLLLALGAGIVAPGCATQLPKGTLSSLGADKVTFIEPSYEPDLKLEISPWANMPSAVTLAKERGEMGFALQAWTASVVASFANTFVSSLQEKHVLVERLSLSDVGSNPRHDQTLVRSRLTAGFVYKTFTSPDFVPFVQVVLQLVGKEGRVVYHQLYVATDRPFNMLMASIPPSTPYVLSSLTSLRTEASPATRALESLAAQLGKHFASELLL